MGAIPRTFLARGRTDAEDRLVEAIVGGNADAAAAEMEAFLDFLTEFYSKSEPAKA